MKKISLNTFIFFIIITTIYIIKVPVAYSNFYAEDGALFFQEANKLQFPLDFINPAGGYLILVSRIIGRAVSFFPIDIVPVVNFLIVCLFLAFVCAVTWQNTQHLIRQFHLRTFCCLSIILLPIMNFELLASSSSLHFILLFPAALILTKVRSNQEITNIDFLVVALTFLSDPTSIFLLLILLKTEAIKKCSLVIQKIKFLYLLICSCVFIQCIYVFHSLDTGARRLENISSFSKALYLYLDRVVGSTLVPNWGFVSSADISDGIFTLKLFIRGTITLVIIIMLLYLLLNLLQWKKKGGSKYSHQTYNAFILLLAPFVYWMTLGYLFNPEPRYAFFPGLCLVVVVLMIVDGLSTGDPDINFGSESFRKYGAIFVMSLFTMTWVFSFSPSPLRTEGPSWREELKIARELCHTQKLDSARLQILPKNWSVEFKCSELERG
jgi:hypothetical protein